MSFCICIRSCKLPCLSIYANTRQQWTKGISASVKTLTSSLFSALKFIEKRHCFFKTSLAVISGSVHCWGNRKRVEIDIRGPKTSCAYDQRTSCGTGSSSQRALNASFQTWVRSQWSLSLIAFFIRYNRLLHMIKFTFYVMWLHANVNGTVTGHQKF